MQFFLGFISGVAVCIFLFTVLAFFRAGVEKRVKIVETVLGKAGPQPQGAIFLPEDEAEMTRRQIIKKNQAEGRDTPLSDLK